MLTTLVLLVLEPAEADPSFTGAASSTHAPARGAWVEHGGQSNSSSRWVVTPTANEVRYRVSERLVGFTLPRDAIGTTNQVSGMIAFTEEGEIDVRRSRIVVDVSGLTSDRSRRDDFVRLSLLDTDNYPHVVFVPTGIRGLKDPLPTTGRFRFGIVGNLTVKQVTRPTVWRVQAEIMDGRIAGSAVTEFTFADFGLDKPSLAFVLSLADDIVLEYDFTLEQSLVEESSPEGEVH